MSRIDEALARAERRTQGTEDGSADPAPASAVFPEEYGERLIDRAAGPTPVRDDRGPLQFRDEAPITALHHAIDLRQVPSAEKLALHSPNGTSIEQYRRVAARLLLAQAERGTRVVMIASAMPGEGKTLTATNLALTLSESYKRNVLLIDADLRRPTIHELLQLPNVTGLNDGLRGAEHKLPLIRVTDTLSVLTAGRPDPDPMSILSSRRIADVIAEASRRFDWVLIDTPPVAVLSDAHLLASLVDSVVLVIQAGETQLAPVKTAMDSLGRDKILGVILNRADDALPGPRYHYYGGAYRASSQALVAKQ